MGAARENVLGACTCPACGSTKASVRLSAKQLAYLVCDTCNLQAFARSGRSDELLRDMIRAPATEPAPEPVPPLTPAQANQTGQAQAAAAAAANTPQPKHTPTPEPAPAPKPAKPAWGMGAW